MSHGSLTNVMGTRFDIIITGKSKLEAEALWHIITQELIRLSNMLNRFDPKSEVSKINRTAFINPIDVTTEMFAILKSCKQYHSQTLGLFDITLKDFSKVSLIEKTGSISFLQSDISLDFGGFAKGYALEKIKKLLLEAHVENCFVDFGNSSILAIGSHPYGDSWKVSVENPFNNEEILAEIALRNTSLSVSGNTPKYGAHIVRPDSGEVVKAKKMICITTKSPLDAEILTTTFVVSTANEKKQLAKSFEIIELLEFNL